MQYINKPFRVIHYFKLGFRMFGAYPLHYLAWTIAPFVFLGATLFFAPLFALVSFTLLFQVSFAGYFLFSSVQLTGEIPLVIDFFDGFSRLKFMRSIALYIVYTVVQSLISWILLWCLNDFQFAMANSFFLQQYTQFASIVSGGFGEIVQQRSLQLQSVNGFYMLPINFLLVFIQYNAVYFIVVRDLSLWDSIRLSIIGVRKKFIGSLAFGLIALILVLAGALCCGIGVLVSLPIISIAFNCGMTDQTGGTIPES